MPVTLGRLDLASPPAGSPPLDADAFMDMVEAAEGPTRVFRAATVAEAEGILQAAGFEPDGDAGGEASVRAWRHPAYGGFVTEVADGIVHLIVARLPPAPMPR